MRQLEEFVAKIDQKIGRRNVILVLFIVSVLLISGLYSTFSLATFSEGVSVIDGVKTLKFVLGYDSDDYSVMIAPNSSKNIAITVSNYEDVTLKYGIYYSSNDDLIDVDLGYRHSSEYLPIGLIEAGKDYIVTLQIDNHSEDMKTISFGVVYGFESGGDFVLGDGQHFLEQKWNFSLNEVSRGSYVDYSGSNGCTSEQCKGMNANDTDEVHQGYCGDDKTYFYNDGWRVAYTRGGSVYLISAGAPQCLAQDSDVSLEEFSKKIDEEALKYCNIDYAYGGVCNSACAWALNQTDFYYVTNNKLNHDFCFEKERDKNCGYSNGIMDVGSYYWVSSSIDNQMLYYYPDSFYYTIAANTASKGIRPVLKLADTIVVTGGKGTKDEPYKIKNTVVANYEYTVVYNGNGASSGDVDDSIHMTNVKRKLNKNAFVLTYKLDLSELAMFDDSYCNDDGTCFDVSVQENETKDAKFLGWSTNKDDKEAMFVDEQDVVNLSVSSDEVVVNLYAIWKLDLNVLPKIQKRDGYKILGWYTSKEGGEKVGDPGDEYFGDKIQLYAHWEKEE